MPRVVLMGDPSQLPPIEAGRPFKLLIENGLRSVRMEDVVRQKKVPATGKLLLNSLREKFESSSKQ